MIVRLPNGDLLRGDVIKRLVVRSDLSPIPLTVEVDLRADDDLVRKLKPGVVMQAGPYDDPIAIVKSDVVVDRAVQGGRILQTLRITALLEPVHRLAYLNHRAIVKEKAALSVVYRSCGASIRAITRDFQVPRFSVFAGQAATFAIAQTLAEEGGVVRWKNGRMEFWRIADLSRQEPSITFADHSAEDQESPFIERHSIPAWWSIDAEGQAVIPDQDAQRPRRFVSRTDRSRLKNLSVRLVRRKIIKTALIGRAIAGDIARLPGADDGLIVQTVAHVFESGTDGRGSSTYSRFWLSSEASI